MYLTMTSAEHPGKGLSFEPSIRKNGGKDQQLSGHADR